MLNLIFNSVPADAQRRYEQARWCEFRIYISQPVSRP